MTISENGKFSILGTCHFSLFLHDEMKKRSMRFLKYLFFKYYYWQERMGNHNSSFMVILFMSFIFMLYFFDILFLRSLFYTNSANHLSKIWVVLVLWVIFLILYFLLVCGGKHKKILKEYEQEWKGKKNLPAILFAVIPFVLIISLIVLMACGF